MGIAMINELQQYKDKVQRLKGARETVSKQIKTNKKNIRELRDYGENLEKLREIIRQAAIETQKQLQYQISDITTTAMNAVFDDPYSVEIEFVEKRNRTECDIHFSRGGDKVSPLNSTGGGAVDVAAFALRIASWSMQTPQPRAMIIMDEPFRFLDKSRQEKASQMLKELSERLGIQFIIVTHEDALTEEADKVFEVKMTKGKSKVLNY